MSKTKLKRISFFSDFHIGSEHSIFSQDVVDHYNVLLDSSDIVVCVGDLVDGRKDEDPNYYQAIYSEISNYILDHPEKDFLFVTGNHEGNDVARGHLSVLAETYPNFHFVDGGLFIGKSLVLHGDQIMRERNEFVGPPRAVQKFQPNGKHVEDMVKSNQAEEMHRLLHARVNSELAFPVTFTSFDDNRITLNSTSENLIEEHLNNTNEVIFGHLHQQSRQVKEGTTFYNLGGCDRREGVSKPDDIGILTAEFDGAELSNIELASKWRGTASKGGGFTERFA